MRARTCACLTQGTRAYGQMVSKIVLVHSWVFQVRVTSQSLNLGSVTRDYVVSHLRIINFLVFWSLDIVEVVSYF